MNLFSKEGAQAPSSKHIPYERKALIDMRELKILLLTSILLAALAVPLLSGESDSAGRIVFVEDGTGYTADIEDLDPDEYYELHIQITDGAIPSGRHFTPRIHIHGLGVDLQADGGLDNPEMYYLITYDTMPVSGELTLEVKYIDEGYQTVMDLGSSSITITAGDLYVIDKPTPAELVYNGQEQTGVEEGTGYTLSGTIAATLANIGDAKYTALASLESGYIWSDGTTTDAQIEWTIQPKAITVEWSATASFVYDGQPHVREATAGGLEAGDACVVTTTGAMTDAGGDYTATATEVSNINYKLPTTGLTATFVITPCSATIDVDDAEKTYGEQDPAFTGTVTGLIGGDTLGQITYGRIAEDMDLEDVGNTIVLSATFEGNNNYSVTVNTGLLTINRASIDPSVSIQGWTYGGTASQPTVSGNSGGGSVSYEYKLSNADEGEYSPYAPTYPGTYTIKATIAETQNYNGGTATADFTISKADLTITANDETIEYGDDAPTYSAQYGGFVYGDDESVVSGLTITCQYTPDYNVGEYEIVPHGASTDNYNIHYTNGTLTVDKKKLAIPTALDTVFTYDGTEQEYIPQGYDQDTMEISGKKRTDAGSQQVTVSIYDDVDYEWTDGTATDRTFTFTIEKASISPVVSIDGWTYGESAKAPSVTGNPEGGAVTYKYKAKTAPESAYSGDVPTHAGEYTVKATVAETDNYLGGEDTEDFTISKAALSITADDKSVTYGEAAPTYTATFVGLVAGDTQSAITGLTLTCGYSAGSNAGSYTITASGGTSSDYEITHHNGTLTVDKKKLAIPTASSTVFTYNGSEQTYTPVGFTPTMMSKSNDKRTNAGSQTVSVSIKDTTNYVWSDDSSTAKTYDFTIGKADPTYTAPVAKTDLVYDGTEKVLITGGTSSHGTFTYSLNGTTYSEDLPKAIEAETYTVHWMLTSDANHNDASGTVTAAIGKYKITFNANGGSCSTSTMTTDENGKLSSLPSASRSGYNFSGWYTSASGGTNVTTSYEFDQDTTVYAHWTAKPVTYRITFDGNGGTPDRTYMTTKTNGRLSSLPADPVWEGHQFDGWYKSRVSSVKVTTSTVFSYNATVYAHWSEYSLGITYYANGGSGSMDYQLIKYSDTSKILNANAFVRDGYVFAGWNTAIDGSGTSYSDRQDVSGLVVDANADLRLYAQWTAIRTVSFAVSDEGYGTVSKQSVTVLDGTAVSVSSDTVTIGDDKITATPAADTDQYHYAFVGWTGIPVDGKVTSDITVTADFTRTENAYAVTVAVSDDGYGTVDRNSITVGYGAAVSASDNILYVGGERITATPAADIDQYSYIFVGWTGIPADGKVASDLTITADFAREDRRCNVTFTVSEGVTKVVKVIPGKTVTPIADPKLAGVEFKGWFLEGSNVRFNFSTPINEDTILYAHFGPKAPSTDQTSKITAVMSKDLTAVVTAYDGKIVGKGTMHVSVYQLMTIRDMQVYVEIGTFEESFDCSRPYFISDVSKRTHSIASGPGSYAVMAEIDLDNGTERLSNYTTFNKEGGI